MCWKILTQVFAFNKAEKVHISKEIPINFYMAIRRFPLYLLFHARGLAFGSLLLPPEGAPA
jgi:hypothetical protein